MQEIEKHLRMMSTHTGQMINMHIKHHILFSCIACEISGDNGDIWIITLVLNKQRNE